MGQLSEIDTGLPDGSAEQVLNLDNRQRESRLAVKTTFDIEHYLNSSVGSDAKDGMHQIPSGATNPTGSDHPTGRMFINTATLKLVWWNGSAWTDVDQTIEAGTKMVFDQDAAPTGWTRDTSYNDKVIRVVSGARADGGSWTISGLSADNESAHTHTGPAHTHVLTTSGTVNHSGANPPNTIVDEGGLLALVDNSGPNSFNRLTKTTNSQGTGATGAGSAHGHTVSAGSSWRPLHRDMIVATKD